MADREGAELLKITAVRKSYGELHALAGVDLTVEPGEVLGLLGPNGAGKTTLASIVAGLVRPDHGTVKIAGTDAARNRARVRPLLGLAPQELGIYPTLSVENNLRFFAEMYGLRGHEFHVRVDEVASALELVPLLRRRAGVLSGGQKRRLHMALALLHRPRLLWLDEPTVGADIRSRKQILALVKHLAAEGCAIVYATHYLQEIEEIGSTVAILSGGRIIARDPLNRIVAAYGAAAVRLRFEVAAPHLEGFEIDGAVATRRTDDPAAVAATTLRTLGHAGRTLSSIEIVRPSLEAAYIALAGRRSTAGAPEGLGQKVDDDAAA